MVISSMQQIVTSTPIWLSPWAAELIRHYPWKFSSAIMGRLLLQKRVSGYIRDQSDMATLLLIWKSCVCVKLK